jgi:hypothetical protein
VPQHLAASDAVQQVLRNRPAFVATPQPSRLLLPATARLRAAPGHCCPCVCCGVCHVSITAAAGAGVTAAHPAALLLHLLNRGRALATRIDTLRTV